MPWNLSYTVQDEGGGVSTFAVKPVSDVDITFEHVLLASNALGQLIDDACEGIVTSVNINFSQAPSWVADTEPLAGSDVEEGGLFNFNVDGSIYTHSVRLPALLQSLFNGKEVNTAAEAIDDLVTALIDGLTVDPGSDEQTVLFGDNYDNPYTALKRAYKSFRK